MSNAAWIFGLAFAGLSAITVILLFRAWGEFGRAVRGARGKIDTNRGR